MVRQTFLASSDEKEPDEGALAISSVPPTKKPAGQSQSRIPPSDGPQKRNFWFMKATDAIM